MGPRSTLRPALSPAALALVALTASSTASGCSDPDPAPGAKPDAGVAADTLATVPCRFVVPRSVEGTAFRCADLPVPENRAKAESRAIRLHVIVFRGKNGGTPTIVLNGGPGGSSEDDAMGLAIGDPRFLARYQKIVDQGDLVFFDQRGAGRSVPRLTCVPEASSSSRDPARDCFARHVEEGVDFAGYDSAGSADDVHDLKVALGATKVNLYGVSYGTRLGLEVLRRHADDVRAAVFDAVLPAEAKVFTETMPNFDGALTKIFAACVKDARCNTAYPDLEGTLRRVKAKLEATPFSLGSDTLDWPALQGIIFDTLYEAEAAGQLPYFLHRIARQTAAEFDAENRREGAEATAKERAELEAVRRLPLGAEVYARLDRGEGPPHREIASDLAFGMYAAVSCADSGQYESLSEATAALGAVREDLRAFGEAEARSAFAACRTLPAIAPRGNATSPVTASVPTLLLGGEVDPITPAAYATRAGTGLSNAQVVVVPGGAHGLVDTCGTDLKARFLEAAGPVDASCATQHALVFYYPP